MTHQIHSVISVDLIGTYSLRVGFNDGSSREIKLEPFLEGEIYGPLRNPDVFAEVKIDPEVRTLVWPNGADFDPAILHDWPQHEEAMRALAKRWALASV
jgi:hypothetical protein